MMEIQRLGEIQALNAQIQALSRQRLADGTPAEITFLLDRRGEGRGNVLLPSSRIPFVVNRGEVRFGCGEEGLLDRLRPLCAGILEIWSLRSRKQYVLAGSR